MGKVIKIIRSFVSAVILLVIFLPVAVTLLLHMQSVQNLIVGQGLKMLSEKPKPSSRSKRCVSGCSTGCRWKAFT